MANVDVNKITNTLGDAMKLAANLSEVTKENKMQHVDDSNNTQTNPNQQVVVHVGDQDSEKAKKPVVIHEKPETHIHKEFPDERALTKDECDLALRKAQMDYQWKERELAYKQEREELARKDRLAREEYERKLEEEKRAKEAKSGKIAGIVMGVLAAIGTAAFGYSVYSNHRGGRTVPVAAPTNSPVAIPGTGTVE